MINLTLREIVKDLEGTLQCNCDLDNWQPNESTGHSDVCRIHKQAMEFYGAFMRFTGNKKS